MNSLNEIVRNQIEEQLTEGFYEERDIDFTDVLIGTYETLDPEGYIETGGLDDAIKRMYENMVIEVIEEYNYETMLANDVEATDQWHKQMSY